MKKSGIMILCIGMCSLVSAGHRDFSNKEKVDLAVSRVKELQSQIEKKQQEIKQLENLLKAQKDTAGPELTAFKGKLATSRAALKPLQDELKVKLKSLKVMQKLEQ